jgi:hypothetical protein
MNTSSIVDKANEVQNAEHRIHELLRELQKQEQIVANLQEQQRGHQDDLHRLREEHESEHKKYIFSRESSDDAQRQMFLGRALRSEAEVIRLTRDLQDLQRQVAKMENVADATTLEQKPQHQHLHQQQRARSDSADTTPPADDDSAGSLEIGSHHTHSHNAPDGLRKKPGALFGGILGAASTASASPGVRKPVNRRSRLASLNNPLDTPVDSLRVINTSVFSSPSDSWPNTPSAGCDGKPPLSLSTTFSPTAEEVSAHQRQHQSSYHLGGQAQHHHQQQEGGSASVSRTNSNSSYVLA